MEYTLYGRIDRCIVIVVAIHALVDMKMKEIWCVIIRKQPNALQQQLTNVRKIIHLQTGIRITVNVTQIVSH